MSQTYFHLVPRDPPELLSIVIPVYNEEEVLPLLLDRLKALIASLRTAAEVIFVNDGSSDRSIQHLLAAAKADPRIKVLSLARNFGHQIACTAGLDHARGDAVIVMDADLQDPPELIVDMLREYRRGYDLVYARRIRREGETAFKRMTAWLFYRVMRKLVHKDLPVDVGDFRLMSAPCLAALRQMRETHRFLRGMATWVGFPQTAVDFVRPARAAGTTKYPLHRMLKFAAHAALSFSPLPLRITFAFGLTLTSVGLVYGIYAFSRSLFGLYTVPGWTSSIVVTSLVGGAVMISIGVLGEYIAKIYEEVKGRPLYVTHLAVNLKAGPEAVEESSAMGARAGRHPRS